jgi:transcriptional regulator
VYAPDAFAEDRRDVLIEAARRIRFASLIACAKGRPIAAHVPLLLKDDGGRLRIEGHFARPNPVARAFEAGAEALALWRGPDAYVHPRWYPKAEGRPVLPTWNYLAVEARGPSTLIDDAAWLVAHLEELVAVNEAERPDAWDLGETADGHVEDLLPGILGVTVEVEDIAGVWKLSQDHPRADRQGVVRGLEAEGTPDAAATAAVMRARLRDEEG